MKICILTQTLNPWTGAGVFTENIIDGIKRTRPHTELSVMTSEDYLKPNIFQVLRNWFYIRGKIKKADLVHVLDGYPYGVIACLANIGVSKPIVITAVGSGSIRKLSGSSWKSLLLRWAYRRATRITAISHYVAQEIKKILPDLSIEVIGHGVDYDFYAGATDNKDVSVPTEYEYVITQGEFKKRKGYAEILYIMKEVMNVRPTVKYMIVADTNRNQSHRDELFELMERLEIRNRIIIKSSLSRKELREIYRNAIIYLTLPINVNGDVEGFGLAILEAAAAGTPAIVGRGSGADDAVSDGQSGFLVDGSNKEEIVKKILSIIDDDDIRKRLSNGAKKWAEINAWPSKIKKYIDIYEKI